MRVALLSDIHGNLVALDAVLADLEGERVDHTVCLGDVAAFGPQPREVLTRLRSLDMPTTHFVTGNTDAWLLDPRPHPVRDEDSGRVNDVELWSAAQLTEDDLAFVRGFRQSVWLALMGSTSLLCVHGSPRAIAEPMWATTADADLEPMLIGVGASIVAAGHTHSPMLRRYRDMLLVNPGSVGLPYEQDRKTGTGRRPPLAECAIVECTPSGCRIEFRRVPFPVDALLRVAQSCGMPHAAWWAASWRR